MSGTRSQCVCLGALTAGLEAHTGASPYQPRGHVCSLGTFGDQVRCWLWCSSDSRLLLRGGRQLVGVQAHQEAHSLHRHLCVLASQLGSACRWLHRRPCPRALVLHQECGRPPGTLSVGRAPPLQHCMRRIPEQHRRLGPQRRVFAIGKRPRLCLPRQHPHLRLPQRPRASPSRPP